MFYKHFKVAVQFAAVALVLIFIFWPWTLALCDLAYWGIHGAQMTPIPWGQVRGVVLILWPVLSLLAINLMFNH